MATKKEVLQASQNQIKERIDFLNRGLATAPTKGVAKLYQQKIDERLDQYNKIQRQIEQL
ncbi:MAG: hypothetical protein WA958_09760 [Tunicatimonas sp.]